MFRKLIAPFLAALAACGGTRSAGEIDCSLRLSPGADVQQAISQVEAGALDPCGDGVRREVLDVDEVQEPDNSISLRFRMRVALLPDRPPLKP